MIMINSYGWKVALFIFKRQIKYNMTFKKTASMVPMILTIFLLLKIILWFISRKKEKKRPKKKENNKEIIWMFKVII